MQQGVVRLEGELEEARRRGRHLERELQQETEGHQRTQAQLCVAKGGERGRERGGDAGMEGGKSRRPPPEPNSSMKSSDGLCTV